MRSIMAALAAAAALGGCSVTADVRGSISETDETFTGTTTGYADRSGDLTIVSNKGARCVGTWVFVAQRQGSGTFQCDDGRTGPFDFVSTGRHGTGHGIIGGKRFTFTFG